MSIRLHSQLGVNPRLVQNSCMLCHNLYTLNELILMGSSNAKFVCKDCGTTSYGGRKCLKNENHRGDVITLEDMESIIVNKLGLCPGCAKDKLVILHNGTDEYVVMPLSYVNIKTPEDGIMMADDTTWNWIMSHMSSE